MLYNPQPTSDSLCISEINNDSGKEYIEKLFALGRRGRKNIPYSVCRSVRPVTVFYMPISENNGKAEIQTFLVFGRKTGTQLYLTVTFRRSPSL